MGRFRDLTGCNFGRLKVIRRGGDYIYPNGRRRPRWECLCSCGNTTVVSANNLIKGVTTSCGCFQTENMSKLKRKHGGYADREPLFSIWCGVRKRCLSPKASNYSNYGGRGIRQKIADGQPRLCSKTIEGLILILHITAKRIPLKNGLEL